jgi:Transport protein particle (TRAPP) component
VWVLLWRLPKDEVPFVIVNLLIRKNWNDEPLMVLMWLVIWIRGFGLDRKAVTRGRRKEGKQPKPCQADGWDRNAGDPLSASSMSKAKIGEDLWKNRAEKVVLSYVCQSNKQNAELFVLTYGSVVAQLCKDTEDASQINKQLDKMSSLHFVLTRRGYNIGVRLIEDFLAKANTGRCHDIRETADVMSKVTPHTSMLT